MWKNEQGGVLILALIIISVLLIIGIVQVKLISLSYQNGRQQLYMLKAQYAAESGIERAISGYLLTQVKNKWQMLRNVSLYADEPFVDGSYSVTLQGINANSVVIHSLGAWKGIQKNIDVTISADWGQEPPIIHKQLWVE
jgi:hypothetical protein